MESHLVEANCRQSTAPVDTRAAPLILQSFVLKGTDDAPNGITDEHLGENHYNKHTELVYITLK